MIESRCNEPKQISAWSGADARSPPAVEISFCQFGEPILVGNI